MTELVIFAAGVLAGYALHGLACVMAEPSLGKQAERLGLEDDGEW